MAAHWPDLDHVGRAAVDAARACAEEGDILLLSPACSSFDMFENYVARGLRFTDLARGEA